MDEPEIKSEETILAPTATTQAKMSSQEVGPIAYEIAKSYEGMVEHFRKNYKLDIVEAVARTENMLDPGTGHPGYQDDLRNGSPQQASWWQLTELARNDPDAMVRRWEGIKQAALDELQSGHTAADAVERPFGNPWQRAQFLAVRKSFMQDWQPTNGIEQSLIDMMAQAQSLYFDWMKQLAMYIGCEIAEQKTKYDKEGNWFPPRVSHEVATEQAAAMADRFNRLFLRTLRQLRDLRRYAPQVNIQNAGQVNIASGQQMNLAKVEAPEPLDD